MTEKEQLFECYPQIHGKRFYLLDGKEFRDNNLIGEKSICFEEAIDTMNQLNDENEQLNEENKSLRIGENEIILKQETTINKLLKENKQLKIELKGIEKENHMLNGKVNRLTDELANCYEKLGW